MTTHTSIVCGLASSADSSALRRTFELARQRDWNTEVIHAVNLPSGLFGLMEADAMTAARIKVLDDLAPALEAFGGSAALERDLRVEQGAPGKVLAKASETAARLVLGPHEREGLTDLFGNTTRALLTQTDCPVWLEPAAAADAAPRPIRRILVAVDLAPEGRQAIALAREEAQAFGADLELVHVFELTQVGTMFGYEVPLPASALQASRAAAQHEFDELVDSFDWGGPWEGRHTRRFLDGEPSAELLERAREADLVVLGTHGRGGFSRALIGSVAAEVTRNVKLPVLAFRMAHGDWS